MTFRIWDCCWPPTQPLLQHSDSKLATFEDSLQSCTFQELQQPLHIWGSTTVAQVLVGLSNRAHRQLESHQQSQIFEDLLQSSPSAATMAFNCSKTVPTRLRTENRRNFFFRRARSTGNHIKTTPMLLPLRPGAVAPFITASVKPVVQIRGQQLAVFKYGWWSQDKQCYGWMEGLAVHFIGLLRISGDWRC